MKKLLLVLAIFFAVSVLNAQTTPPVLSQTDVSKVVGFKELEHDFGKIPYGKPAEFDIVMKNLTNDTLRLTKVVAGCGCTTPKWVEGPYKAGETFKATIGFNGYGINSDSSFSKIVTVYFGNGMSQVVKFHGTTYKVPDTPAPANPPLQKLKTSGNK